ncbi:MAG: YcgN family cysteine cluster protein [Alphaproteobacteria bacterium]|nr:YcgN family cysteine cluster protein [Alphaproteobacteria bacterium]
MSQDKFFWKNKKLEDMSESEWEQLCDGCGQCCMHKLEDEDTGKIFLTTISCKLLDSESCKCKNYLQRHKFVNDCIKLNYTLLEQISWLPKTCAYLKIFRGEDLEWWHPLLSGDCRTVHEAKISAKDRITATEDSIDSEEEYLNHISGELL